MSSDITVCIFNFNGFRNSIYGKGRIQLTIESLLECCPILPNMKVIFVDNESVDGSLDYLKSLGFGEVLVSPREVKEANWLATTRNNMASMNRVVELIETRYMWRIEDDSYFYNKSRFWEKAVRILGSDEGVDIIHLRRWTRIDCLDMPGVGRNLTRVSEKRLSPFGDAYFMIEKRDLDAVWVSLGDDLPKDFEPDKEGGYGKCPEGLTEIGSVRLDQGGKRQRLLTEKWATYNNHGWIAKTDRIRFCFNRASPKSEGELASVFRGHFTAARMDEDAFIAFGWRTRYPQWTAEEATELFRKMRDDESCSVYDYGIGAVDHA